MAWEIVGKISDTIIQNRLGIDIHLLELKEVSEVSHTFHKKSKQNQNYVEVANSPGEFNHYSDVFVQDCSNSISNALELLQSCTKLSFCLIVKKNFSINSAMKILMFWLILLLPNQDICRSIFNQSWSLMPPHPSVTYYEQAQWCLIYKVNYIFSTCYYNVYKGF